VSTTVNVETSKVWLRRWLVVFLLPLSLLAIASPETFLGLSVVVTACAFIMFLARRFERVVFLVFMLIAWFPEYSQLEDVFSAEDFQSLYNYKPIPWITASIFDYFFALAVLIWIARVGWPRRKAMLEVFLARPMLWFLGLSTFSLCFGIARGYPVYYALKEYRVSSYFVLFYFMSASVLQNPARRVTLTKLVAWTGIAVGCVGIGRYMLGIGKDYYGTLLVYYDIADSMVMYVALFILASVWLVRRRSLAVIILLSVPLLFSLIFSFPRFVRWLAPLLAGAVVAGALFFASNWQGLVSERLASIVDTSEDPSNVFRILDTLNALTTFARHPILGIGSGGQYDFEYYSEAVPPIFWENASRTCHDGYLYVLYKMGLVGFIAYITIFYHFVRRWIRLRKSAVPNSDRIAYYGLGTGAIAILINNFTSPVSYSLRPTLLLAVIMACVSSVMTDCDHIQTIPT
jgi:O-antigen ligase